VKNGIYVSALRYSDRFDHSALLAGMARTYAQRGFAVKSEPALPGGKRADLAVVLRNGWTYIEVKTRANGTSPTRRVSLRQDFLREILRLRAHSLKQLPAKESSLIALATSISQNRRRAISKITIARSFARRIFDDGSKNLVGLMIFAPFRNRRESSERLRYACTLIPNPHWKTHSVYDELGDVQL